MKIYIKAGKCGGNPPAPIYRQYTSRKMAVGLNGFVYRELPNRPLTATGRKMLKCEIIEWKSRENLKRLNSNQSNFIK